MTQTSAIGAPIKRHLWTVFLVGLITGLVWTFLIFPRLAGLEQVFDLNGFGQIAENIHQGKGFSGPDGPTVLRAPLYSYLMAGLFAVFGFDPANREASYWPVLVLHCILFAFTCVLAYLIGTRLFGPRSGLTAAVLCAIWPQTLRYVATIDVELLVMFLTALVAHTTLRLYLEPTIKNGLLAGLALALSVLAKPMPLFYPLVLAGLLVVRARHGVVLTNVFHTRAPLPVLPFLAVIAVMAALIAPWMVRNHIISGGKFRGINSTAPGNFLRGYVNMQPKYWLLREVFKFNNDMECNLFENRLMREHGFIWFEFRDGQWHTTPMPLEREIERDRVEAKIAKQMVREDPLRFLQKWFIQLFTFWYLVETPGRSLIVGFFALLALSTALLATADARRRSIPVAPIWAIILYTNMMYAVFISFGRFSMPLYATLLVLSGHGFCLLWDRLRRAPRETEAAPAA